MAMASPISHRDRTSDFFAVVDRCKVDLQGQASSIAPSSFSSPSLSSSSSSSSASLPSSSSSSSSSSSDSKRFDFNREASRIGISIQDAEKKVSRLSKLTKRSSMFDDPTREIEELTAVISQDLTRLNSSIQQLESIGNLRVNTSSQNVEHCKAVLENLKGRLMQATNSFKEVLTTRTESLKVRENRRQLFTAAPATEKNSVNALNSSNVNGASSLPIQTPPPWANTSSQTAMSRATVSDPSTSAQLRRRTGGVTSFSAVETQMQIQQESIPLQDNSRLSALHAVESTIAELSGMFTQVASMVSQQGELAIRIDDNMEDTLANVQGAQGNLLKYLHRVSSNRWLLVKIFIVLIIFLIVFIIFVA